MQGLKSQALGTEQGITASGGLTGATGATGDADR